MNKDVTFKSISTFLFLLFAATVFSQNTDIPFGDLPPTNEFGKCYAKCRQPDTYETVTKSVLVKEASTKLVKVPAVYETKYEKVLVKEASKTYKVIPATYRTVTEKILVTPEKKTVRTVPAKFETKTRRILVSEARGEWVKKKKEPNCFSENPDDCFIVCYEEVPAVYRTETYQVMTEPARTIEDYIPAKYKTVTRKVVDREASVVEVPIDAVYKTIATKVLVSPATTREETIPAVYKDVKERHLVSKGTFSVWTEILCASQTTSSKVRKVQRALKARGYNPGPIDGVLGIQTQTALKQFQNDNGLPLGNLNLKTLKELGVEVN